MDTAYNGYNGFSDGPIVAKTINRQSGCGRQGFEAFTSGRGPRRLGPPPDERDPCG